MSQKKLNEMYNLIGNLIKKLDELDDEVYNLMFENSDLKDLFAFTSENCHEIYNNTYSYDSEFNIFALYNYDDHIILFEHEQDLDPIDSVYILSITSYYDSIAEYLDKNITIIPKNSFFGHDNTNFAFNSRIKDNLSTSGIVRLFKSLFNDAENKYMDYCATKFKVVS